MIFVKQSKNTTKVLMLFFKVLFATSVAAITLISGSAVAEAIVNSVSDKPQNSAHLVVTPKRCIALRKGQVCYLEVDFSWQHAQINDYCLVNTTTSKTIKCWQQQRQGEFSFDFQSTLSNDFALRHKTSTIDLANTQIIVAWVYKSSKRAKSTWRLF